MNVPVHNAVASLVVAMGLLIAPVALGDITPAAADEGTSEPMFTLAEIGLGSIEAEPEVDLGDGVLDLPFTQTPVSQDASLFSDPVEESGDEPAEPPVPSVLAPKGALEPLSVKDLLDEVPADQEPVAPTEPFAGASYDSPALSVADAIRDDPTGFMAAPAELEPAKSFAQAGSILYQVDDWDYRNIEVVPAPAGAVLGLVGLGLVGWVRRRG